MSLRLMMALGVALAALPLHACSESRLTSAPDDGQVADGGTNGDAATTGTTCAQAEGTSCQPGERCSDVISGIVGTAICCKVPCTSTSTGTMTCEVLGGDPCESADDCTGDLVSASDTELCCERPCEGEPLQTCNEQGGSLCSTSESCPISYLEASDSTHCCPGACEVITATTAQWGQSGYSAAKDGRSPYNGPAVQKLKWLLLLEGGWGSSVVVGRDGTAYVTVSWQDAAEAWLLVLDRGGAVRWEQPVALGSSVALGRDNRIYAYVQESGSHRLMAYDTEGVEQWTLGLAGLISSDLTIAEDGEIYFAVTTGGQFPDQTVDLYAVSPTGETRWTTRTSTSGWGATPAVSGDTVYAGGDRLQAIDRSTGDIRWSLPIQTLTGTFGPAVAPDGTVVAATTDWQLDTTKALVAVNPDGTERWRVRTGLLEMTPAMTNDGGVVFHAWPHTDPTAMSDGLFALDLADGATRWSLTGFIIAPPDPDLPSPNIGSDSSPIIGANGMIYMGADNGSLFAIQPDGNIEWALPLAFELDNRPSIGADGTLYICNGGGVGNNKCFAVSDAGTLDPPADPWDGWDGSDEGPVCDDGTSCDVAGEYGCECPSEDRCSSGEWIDGCCIAGDCGG